MISCGGGDGDGGGDDNAQHNPENKKNIHEREQKNKHTGLKAKGR